MYSDVSHSNSMWKFRKRTSSGLALVAFIPAIDSMLIISGVLQLDKYSGPPMVCSMVSALNCVVVLVGALWPDRPVVEWLFRGITSLTALGVMLAASGDLWDWVILCICQSFVTSLIKVLPRDFPHAFSLGEVLYVSQAVTSFLFNTLLVARHSFMHLVLASQGLTTSGLQISPVVVVCKSIGLCLLVLALMTHKFETVRSPGVFVVVVIVTLTLLLQLLLHAGLGAHPVVWLVRFLAVDALRLKLLLAWLCLSLASVVLTLTLPSLLPRLPLAILRKTTHILIVTVYVSGLANDPQFLLLASVAAFCVFVGCEVARIYDIVPLSDIVEQVYSGMLDHQDSDILTTSHIYLLAGCSLPLWFWPHDYTSDEVWPGGLDHAALYSGVVTLGIGDGFAAVCGSLWGSRLKWPGSRKSVIGTTANIVSQLLSYYCLYWTGCIRLPELLPLVRVLTLCVVTSAYEAVTSQVDNLVLPPVGFILSLLLLS